MNKLYEGVTTMYEVNHKKEIEQEARESKMKNFSLNKDEEDNFNAVDNFDDLFQ